jgi:hypothetical protein
MSPEDAAPLAGVIKARRWRQIEGGWPVSDEVLAHMAHAVGVSPEQLGEAGRGESAEILREILRQEAADSSGPGASDAELADLERALGVDLSMFEPDKRRGLLVFALALIRSGSREERRGA